MLIDKFKKYWKKVDAHIVESFWKTLFWKSDKILPHPFILRTAKC